MLAEGRVQEGSQPTEKIDPAVGEKANSVSKVFEKTTDRC